MIGDGHVPFRGSLGVKLPGATRLPGLEQPPRRSRLHPETNTLGVQLGHGPDEGDRIGAALDQSDFGCPGYVKNSLTGDYIRAAAAAIRIGFLTLSDELSIGRDNHDRYTGLSASAPLPPRWFRDQAVVQPRDGGRGRRCIHAGGAVRLCGQAAR